MKKVTKIEIIICAGLLSLITGCGSGQAASTKTNDQTVGVEEVLQQKMAEDELTEDELTDEMPEDLTDAGSEDLENKTPETETAETETAETETAETETAEGETTVPGTTEGIDVDLTTMSATMVYSEVSNMLMNPDQYMGKTIKMNGQLSVYHDTDTQKDYYACIIADATACCSQGIEFELADKIYPQEGQEVTVVGKFDTYMEKEYQYCTLRNAELLP